VKASCALLNTLPPARIALNDFSFGAALAFSGFFFDIAFFLFVIPITNENDI
jgi:hypothetical protein